MINDAVMIMTELYSMTKVIVVVFVRVKLVVITIVIPWDTTV